MVVNVLESDENEPSCGRDFRDRKANRRGGGRARGDPAPHGPTPAKNVAGESPGADPHALELIAFYQKRPRAASRRLQNLTGGGGQAIRVGAAGDAVDVSELVSPAQQATFEPATTNQKSTGVGLRRFALAPPPCWL
jgi:hypothetical protein